MSKSDQDLASALNRAAGGTAPRAKSKAQQRKALLLRLDPGVHKRLRMLAIEHDTTLQALAEEALQHLLKRYEN